MNELTTKLTKKERELKAKNDKVRASCARGRFQLIGNKMRDEALRLLKLALKDSVGNPGLLYAFYGQITRGLNSIGAAVHEGAGRSDGQDLLRFLKIARGSAYECIFHAECLELENLSDYHALADLIDAEIIAFIDAMVLSDEAGSEAEAID